MRHRDMAAIAVLLLVAAISLIMFVRSWRQAGARARMERMERSARQLRDPADAEEVSWTRGRLDSARPPVEERADRRG